MTPENNRATLVGTESPSENSTTFLRPGRRPSVRTIANKASVAM